MQNSNPHQELARLLTQSKIVEPVIPDNISGNQSELDRRKEIDRIKSNGFTSEEMNYALRYLFRHPKVYVPIFLNEVEISGYGIHFDKWREKGYDHVFFILETTYLQRNGNGPQPLLMAICLNIRDNKAYYWHPDLPNDVLPYSACNQVIEGIKKRFYNSTYAVLTPGLQLSASQRTIYGFQTLIHYYFSEYGLKEPVIDMSRTAQLIHRAHLRQNQEVNWQRQQILLDFIRNSHTDELHGLQLFLEERLSKDPLSAISMKALDAEAGKLDKLSSLEKGLLREAMLYADDDKYVDELKLFFRTLKDKKFTRETTGIEFEMPMGAIEYADRQATEELRKLIETSSHFDPRMFELVKQGADPRTKYNGKRIIDFLLTDNENGRYNHLIKELEIIQEKGLAYYFGYMERKEFIRNTIFLIRNFSQFPKDIFLVIFLQTLDFEKISITRKEAIELVNQLFTYRAQLQESPIVKVRQDMKASKDKPTFNFSFFKTIKPEQSDQQEHRSKRHRSDKT